MPRHLLTLLTTIALTVTPPAANSTWAADLFIVVNAPSGSSVDQGALESLLTGQRRNWDKGDPAKVILPSRTSPHFDTVAQQLFGASGRVMQRSWFRLVFSGRANAPDYAENNEAVIERVASQLGALGIVVASAAPEVSEELMVISLR